MSEETKEHGKVLKVFRLESNAYVSVRELGVQVQSVRADHVPLSSESRFRSAFESAGLTPKQVIVAASGNARYKGRGSALICRPWSEKEFRVRTIWRLSGIFCEAERV